jgi:hypothetical protein
MEEFGELTHCEAQIIDPTPMHWFGIPDEMVGKVLWL